MTADIAMFVHSLVSLDGRVLKEAASLATHGWRVVVIGIALNGGQYPAEEIQGNFTIRTVTPRLFPGRSGSWVKLLRLIVALPQVIRELQRVKAYVYHANDFTGLLVMALAGIWRCSIVYDSRELFFDRFPSGYPLNIPLRLLRPLERPLAQRAVAVITVGDAVADRLAETLSIPRPIVVRNAVDLNAFDSPVPIQRRKDQSLIAHSGYLSLGRNLPELVASLVLLPDTIALALVGDGPLRPALATQATSLGVADRLLFVYPVTPTNITPTLAQADAAIMLITSQHTNYHLSLPNKFFEAVAAGLPIVSSPIPEVTALIERYDLGVTCDPTDPASIAAAIQTVLLPDNNTRFRANALRAREELNWAAEEKKLVALYERILGKPGAAESRVSPAAHESRP